MNVLVFVNSVSTTSIPLEIASKVEEHTEANVLIASFYDSSPIDLEPDVMDYGLEIVPLGGESRLDIRAYRKLYKLVKTKDIDILHTHHNAIGSIARAIFGMTDIAIVNTEHRDHESFSFLQNLVNAPTLSFADKIISNSHVTQMSFRWYESLLLNDNHLTVIHNGVDIERIDDVVSEAPTPDNDSTFRICTVGRMVPVKNQSTLLRAFKLNVEQRSNAELLLVGDGPLRGDLEALARRLEIAKYTRFTGEVTRRQVYEYFAQSDVFAMPSHAEGFCVALVEAMAAGLPVVVSDIPVFHEVVNDCGIYADPDSSQMFASEFKHLLENKRYRNKKADSCQSRARNNFSLDRTAMEYYKVYKSIVK